MLTREALQESLKQAEAEMERAPVDGMLAYLIACVDLKHETPWNQDRVATVALAYANAVQKNGGRG